MIAFKKYVDSLDRLSALGSGSEWLTQCKAALDGEPSRQLRANIDIATRRANGAFFTGAKLADKVTGRIGSDVRPKRAFDPACGAGDLLISCARGLPTKKSVEATLRSWGRILYGRDKHLEFVRATKLRLCLLAQQRLKAPAVRIPASRLSGLLRNVRQGDGLQVTSPYRRARWIIMNPPFTRVLAKANCTWAAGTVNSAAVFVEHCLASMRVGDRVTAVLPDVLRSGSRYAAWRQLVSKYLSKISIHLHGGFDHSADVDVFILDGIRCDARVKASFREWLPETTKVKRTVGTLFDVSVGAVVPHRLTGQGKWRIYIHAKSAGVWREIRTMTRHVRFKGTLHAGPLVLVRRTSSPSDKLRAVATLINSRQQIAVENHLIVCKPKSGRLGDCRDLVAKLRHKDTTEFLNKRIRCRHLTVGAVREIPL